MKARVFEWDRSYVAVALTPQPPLPKGEGEPDQSPSPSERGFGVRAGGGDKPIYHGNVNTP